MRCSRSSSAGTGARLPVRVGGHDAVLGGRRRLDRRRGIDGARQRAAPAAGRGALVAEQPRGLSRRARTTRRGDSVILWHEHTWGAADSVSSPRSRGRRRAVELQARVRSRGRSAIDARSMAAAEPPPGAEVDVVNTLSWKRSGLVIAVEGAVGREGSGPGQPRTDLPSQRLADGTLAVWVADVPALRLGSSPTSQRGRSGGRRHQASAPRTRKLDNRRRARSRSTRARIHQQPAMVGCAGQGTRTRRQG